MLTVIIIILLILLLTGGGLGYSHRRGHRGAQNRERNDPVG